MGWNGHPARGRENQESRINDRFESESEFSMVIKIILSWLMREYTDKEKQF